MIASKAVPWVGATWAGFLVCDQRSRRSFNPVTGAWEPFVAPLGGADLNRLLVRPGGPMPFASIITWPVAESALVWCDIGDTIEGDQVVAFRYDIARDGTLARADVGQAPLWMDLSPAGAVQWADGSTMKPVATDGAGRPAVP